MEFMSPRILDMDRRRFYKNYTVWSDSRDGETRYLKGYKNLDHLVGLISPYIYDAALDLDIERRYSTTYYSNDFPDEYNAIKREILGRMEYGNVDFYEMCTRLQSLYARSPSKTSAIDGVVDGIDDRAIVFVKYLSSIPSGAHRMTGMEAPKQREYMLRDFRADRFKTLYMTYGVGAYGLNLQFCNHVVFADQTFDYAQKIQAQYRVYRIGQQNAVTYHDMVCRCGLEGMIMDCLGKKQGLLARINTLIKEGVDWARDI
jgi:hypothetical protein